MQQNKQLIDPSVVDSLRNLMAMFQNAKAIGETLERWQLIENLAREREARTALIDEEYNNTVRKMSDLQERQQAMVEEINAKAIAERDALAKQVNQLMEAKVELERKYTEVIAQHDQIKGELQKMEEAKKKMAAMFSA